MTDNELENNELDDLVAKIEALAENDVNNDPGSAENISSGEADETPEDDAQFDSPDDGFEGVNTVSLFDEEGNEYTFELLDYVDFKDKLYAILIPAELYGTEDDEQVVIMETYFEGDEPNFVFVEDEALAQQILDIYASRDAEE